MTTPNHTASIDAELTLKIQLGPQIIAYRPAAQTESGPDWKTLDEDTNVCVSAPCNLHVRLLAYDLADEPIDEPAWTVNASCRTAGGSWQSLPDLSSIEADYLTSRFAISDVPRMYRFTVGLQGSTVSATYELDVTQHDASGADDDDDDDDGHDILFDPADDLKPPPKPTSQSTETGSIDSLVASG